MTLALKKIGDRKPLGQVLVERGLLTEAERDLVLKKAEKSGRRMGQVLVDDGYINDFELAKNIAEVFGLGFIDLNELSPQKEALAAIPYKIAKQYCVFPVSLEGSMLTIATNDPMNGAQLSTLKQLTHQRMVVKVASVSQIKSCIEKHYQQSAANMSLEDAATQYKETASTDQLVRSILERAIALDASDIHIEPTAQALRVRHRIHGILREVGDLSLDMHLPLIAKLKVLSSLDVAEKRQSQDGSFHFQSGSKSVDIRLSTLPTIQGEKAVMRILDKSLLKPQLEELGMPREMSRALEFMIGRPSGILLVTGPTGSGKTTTVYSLIEMFNHSEKNLITIEDPVEYRLEKVNQVQVHVKAGVTFPAALRSMLRQDPDVIVVGEIRDRETAEIAIRAALTGHVVISTLHTNDSVTTLSRLIDMGIEPYLIASSLLGVVSQRLVRTLCPSCRKSAPITDSERSLLGESLIAPSALVGIPTGCPKCSGGYRGRSAIFELLKPTPRIKEAITKHASDAEILELMRRDGFHSTREDGIAKALALTTSIEEVLKQTV